MSRLPYEIIDIILKMASTTTDLYHLQIDQKTGKLIYKHNMHCPKLSNLKINPLNVFYQNLLYNDIMYNYLINDIYEIMEITEQKLELI